jgi:CxxC motif-containing protein
VLLILVVALGATMLVLQAGDRVEVVQVTKEIQAGESVNGSNTTSVLVAKDDSIHYVQWSQLDALKSLKARSTIYAGTVVIGDMFGEGASVPAGKAAVGVALKEGQYPADIQPGDTVAVYNVETATSGSGSNSSNSDSTSASSGSAIVEKAKVQKVAENSDATVSTGNLSVTLLVDQADAAAVAKASSGGAVAVVHVSGN